MFNYQWKPYVSVAERRRKAEREMQKLKKKGHPVSPVVIEGRAIAKTFWGKAWCDNLEHYSDYANRLPRGRTYVRNGSVLDLQIAPGEVKALVNGSEIYEVAVSVAAVPKARWASICTDCAGSIDSLVELLQGQFSKGVMTRICQVQTGLFPAPSDIKFSCSCPDWASMCKHVAAVIYGIGARLDEQPEMLFKLRKVDHKELVAKAGHALPLPGKSAAQNKVLAIDDMSALFGLEMVESGFPATSDRAHKPPNTPPRQRSLKTSVRSKKKAPTTKTAKPRTSKSSSPSKIKNRKALAPAVDKVPGAKTAKQRAHKSSSTVREASKVTSKKAVKKKPNTERRRIA